MAVLIKDMEMPKSCTDCVMCYDLMLCPITDTKVDWEKMDTERLPNCPLKESHEIQDIIQCKDCMLYIQPEQGKVYGRCTYPRDSTPKMQTDFCSCAK